MNTTHPHRAFFLILVLAALVFLPLGGCANLRDMVNPAANAKTTTPSPAMTASAIAAAIYALPASLKTDVAVAIAKFPSANADLETVANGVETLATDAAAHPLPTTLQNTIVGLAELVPGKIGAVASGVAVAYQVAYPLLSKVDNALVGLGEFIRTFETTTKATATAITSAVNARLHSARQMAYSFWRRMD